jgi:AcrR family transcriptional regulator
MRAMGRPSTREKLLDCAEDLFGRHGLEGVSLRTINTEAGLSPAALHYHFGSKEMLVEALLERRMPALMERRSQLLDELSAREQLPSTRDALSTLLVPLVDMVAEGGEHSRRYLRLIHRLHADHDLDPQFVIDRWPGSVTRLVPLLRAANPSLPKSIVEFRLGLVIELMLQSLAHGAPTTSEGFEAHVEKLLDFLTGGFLAASHGEPK